MIGQIPPARLVRGAVRRTEQIDRAARRFADARCSVIEFLTFGSRLHNRRQIRMRHGMASHRHAVARVITQNRDCGIVDCPANREKRRPVALVPQRSHDTTARFGSRAVVECQCDTSRTAAVDATLRIPRADERVRLREQRMLGIG